MQKLKTLLREKKGSTLVGAVALCTIMTIGAAGLMAACRHTVSHEQEAYHDAQAFLAAESGLLMGMNHLKLLDYDKVNTTSGTLINTTVAGIPVLVSFDGGALYSVASHEQLNYDKQLTWQLNISKGVGQKGTCSGCFGQATNNAFSHSDFEGFQYYTTGGATNKDDHLLFDGPYFSNWPIKLYGPNQGDVFFNDEVTVYNGHLPKAETYCPVYCGVSVSKLPGSYKKDDVVEYFGNKVFSRGKVDVVDYELEPRVSQPVQDTIILPTIGAAAGTSAATSLRFGYLPNGNTSSNSFSFNGQPYSINPNRTTHIIANEKLTIISGVVTGQITVETTPGNDIIVKLDGTSAAGDGKTLVYRAGYSGNAITPTSIPLPSPITKNAADANFGIGYENADDYPDGYTGTKIINNNVLALYSGKDINLIGATTGKASDRNLLITAQLFAWNGSVKFPGSNSNNIYDVVGSVAQGEWHDWNASQKQSRFYVYHDKRQMSAPGIMFWPKGSNPNNNGTSQQSVKLDKIKWKEDNIKKVL